MSTRSETAPPSATLGIVAAVAAVTAIGMSGTLTYPLIALLLERAGESGARIGVNTALASVGMLVSALVIAPPAMARLGVVRFMLLCIAVSVVTLALFPLTTDFWAWAALRFVLGAAGAGMFLASEYWIVAAAPEGRRGRVVAIYAVALSVGYAVGPSILLAVGVDGWAPFLAAIGLTTLAAVPVIAARRSAPPLEDRAAAPALRFFVTDPTLVWAVALFGAVEFGAMGLAPVWGVRVGMSETTAVGLALALAAGALAAQPLIAWASDRYAPRPLLVLAALAVLASAGMLALVGGSVWAAMAVMAFWGGVSSMLYNVALVGVGARYKGADLAAANGAIIAAYGVGALVGPPFAGRALDLLGSGGLSAAVATLAGAYLLLAVSRLFTRPR